MSVLLRTIPGANVRDTWVTQIFRCASYGIPSFDSKPLYQREYVDAAAAKAGHQDIVNCLRHGHQAAAFGFTTDQIVNLSWLRAVEWLGWPAFVSQPIVPLLYVFFPWYCVLAALVLANALWLSVRYEFVHYPLATSGCLFVRLKWLVMIGVGIYFLSHKKYFLLSLTAFTPMIAAVICGLFRGQVGVVQKIFRRQLEFEADVDTEMVEVGRP